MSNRLNLIFCCVRAKLLGYRLICMFGFNQRAVHSHMALFVLDLGNDLDLLNAAVIKAEHLKCVLHHCSSIGKCTKTRWQKKASHGHIFSTLLSFHAAVLRVFERLCVASSQQSTKTCVITADVSAKQSAQAN